MTDPPNFTSRPAPFKIFFPKIFASFLHIQAKSNIEKLESIYSSFQVFKQHNEPCMRHIGYMLLAISLTHLPTHPLTPITGCWGVMMEASAIRAYHYSVFSNLHQCGSATSSPLFNGIQSSSLVSLDLPLPLFSFKLPVVTTSSIIRG